MKKIIAAVLALVTLLSLVPAYAASGDGYSDYEQQADVLCALDILSEDLTEEAYGELISKAEFVQLAVHFMSEDYARYGTEKPVFSDVLSDNLCFSEIMYALSRGIIEKSDKFYPDKYIDYDEALTILVKMTGYEALVENGNYTGKAGELKITKGLEKKDGVRKCDAVRMLYNCLEVEMPEQLEISANKYKVEYLRTAIDFYRGIKYGTGVVTQTYFCAANGSGISGVGENDVVINGVVYTDNYGRTEDILGCNTEFYYNDEKNIIFYIGEYKNNRVTVQKEDFDSYTSGRFTYYENNRKVTLKISDTVDVIYNLDYYPDFTEDDILLTGLTGNDTFIDNNKDGIYDLIVINEYKDYALRAVDAEHKILYAKAPEETIKLDACRDIRIVDAEKGEIDFESITPEHIVSVQRSKATEERNAIYRIYTAAKTKVGSVNFAGSSKEYARIGGEKYKVNSNAVSVILEGQAGLVYFDFFGNIAYADYSVQHTGFAYAFLVSVWKDGSGDTVTAKLLDTEGKVSEYSFADRVRLDGKSLKPAEVCDGLSERGYTKRQLIKVELNKDGGIAKIDTSAHGENEYSESELVVKKLLGVTWYGNNSGFNTINNEYCLARDAVMFIVPNIGNSTSADNTDYRVSSPKDYYIPTKTTVTMDVADPDDGGMAKVGVYYYTYSSNIQVGGNEEYSTYQETNSYMVDSVTQELDETDDTVKTYLYYFDNGRTKRAEVLDPNVTKKPVYKQSVTEGETDWIMKDASGNEMYKDLVKGDVIQFRTDDRGVVTSVYVNNDSERVDNGRFGSNSSGRGEFGMVYSKSGDGVSMVIKTITGAPLYNPTAPEETFEIVEASRLEKWRPFDFNNTKDKAELEQITVRTWACSSRPVVYNKERDTIRLGDFSDIIDYKTAGANPSLAYMRTYHITNRCIFVYE